MESWVLLSSILASLSVILSFYLIILHRINYNKPYLQKHVIRVIFLVPLYSSNALFAIVLPFYGGFFDPWRECYEAYVLYSFMQFLMNYLHHNTNLDDYIDQKTGPKNIFPLCCLPTCAGGRKFLLRCQDGILQYVIVRPTTAIVAFVFYLLMYKGFVYAVYSGYIFNFLLIVNNISQTLATYGLAIFYSSYKEELEPIRPFGKFMSIKLVVFFCFFQSVAISFLVQIEGFEEKINHLFPDVDSSTSGRNVPLESKLDNSLICLEMLVASIGNLWAFSIEPFTEQDNSLTGLTDMIRQMLLVKKLKELQQDHGPIGEIFASDLQVADEPTSASLDLGIEKDYLNDKSDQLVDSYLVNE